jgi:monoamine oxidase
MVNENTVYDVVVVGAGISGLTAAYNLVKKLDHIKILIIEAKDRVGGRTRTIQLKCSNPEKTSSWDVGGQWVTDTQTQITKLLEELNIETYDQFVEGKKVLEVKKKTVSYNSSIPKISIFGLLDLHMILSKVNSYADKVNTLHPFENLKLAQQLDSSNLDTFLFTNYFTSVSRAIVQSAIRTVFGAEVNQINTLFGLTYVKSGELKRTINRI